MVFTVAVTGTGVVGSFQMGIYYRAFQISVPPAEARGEPAWAGIQEGPIIYS